MGKRGVRKPSRLDPVVFAGFQVLAQALAALPERGALALGRGVVDAMRALLPVRQRVAMTNLRYCLGDELSERALRRLSREAYHNAAMTLVELVRAGALGGRQPVRTVFERPEALRALGDGPLIVCAPHAGNFDLTGHAAAAMGLPVTAVMRPLRSPLLTAWLAESRRALGVSPLMKGSDAFLELLDLLDDGGWAALLPDQHAGRNGVHVKFLGRPASTYKAPAVLHLLSGASIVVAVDRRSRRDPRQHFTRWVRLPDHASTGDREADVVAITARICDAMSRLIREAPGQYLWLHRRWGKQVPARFGRPLKGRCRVAAE